MINRKFKNLKKLLKEADDAYYNKSQPIITDAEYDKLRDQYNKLNPNDLWVGSPVSIVSEWKKEKHNIPMTSLNKVNSEEEFRKWANNVKSSDFIIMEKLDGLSIDLEYKNGNLVDAITRGDGIEGESILSNVKKMKNVKNNIKNFNGSLRGEIIFLIDDFNKTNNDLLKNNNKKFKNLRNSASGLSKRYDGKYSENLSVIFYDCSLDFITEKEKILFIEKELELNACFYKNGNIDDIIKIFNYYEENERDRLDHEIDGMVIRVNDINLQKKLGLIGLNPKGQIAWKFKPIIKKTKLIDIEWSIGKNKRITPIGILNPIKLGGVEVKRVNLHNIDNFNKLKPYKNCDVLIKRAGDVIPQLIGIV